MRYLVSYDIIKDYQRTKLAKQLNNYGHRVQYSVFECDLTEKQLTELKTKIMQFVDEKKDSLRIYTLCQSCVRKIEKIGSVGRLESDEAVVI